MSRGMKEALRQAVVEGMAARQPPETEVIEQQTVEEPAEEVVEAPEETVEVQADQEDDEGIEYLNDLPEALGWKPEEFYELKLKLSEGDPVRFGDIKDRLQSVDAERQQIAQQREELQKQQQQLQQQMMQAGTAQQNITTEMAQADAEIKAIEGAYGELEKDWAEREKTNPGQVANERVRIGQRYEQAKQKLAMASQQAQQQQQVAYQQWLAQENQRLLQADPDLAKPEKRREIAEFAMSHYGMTPQELAFIDHKRVMLIKDAMDAVRIKESTAAAVKKVKKNPRVVPRGVRIKAGAVTKARAAELAQKARSTRSRQDHIDAVKAAVLTGISKQR